MDFDGPQFTWTNGSVWQRLNRALTNVKWALAYPISRVSHLARGRSDHAPLLVKCAPRMGSPRSFRFLNVWARHPGFLPLDIKTSATEFYADLFTSESTVRGGFPDLPFAIPSVGSVQNDRIREVPSAEEIREVVFSMDLNSAPGPDGFGVGFYQKCWEIIKDDLVKSIHDFFRGVSQPQGWSSSLIVLVPKVEDLCFRTFSNSWFSVLINGESAGYFKSSRRVRQGDLLSPALFLFLFLEQYQAWSGQKVSIGKSSFCPALGASPEQLQLVLSTLGFREQRLPIRYLGVPLTKGRVSCVLFDGLLTRLRQRLFHWSSKLLSTGGKIVLIRHVLNSIPLHLLQVLQPPNAVLVALGRICNAFLWDRNTTEKRVHWAAWEKVCFPVEEGGLGVRAFGDVLRARLLEIQDFAEGRIRWCLGKGLIDFWQDRWCTALPLAQLLGLSNTPDVLVGELYLQSGWDVARLKSWLPEHYVARILELQIFPDLKDHMVWEGSPSGEFSVLSTMEALRQKRSTSMVSRYIWGTALPKKISFFVWRLVRQWVPLDEQLQRKGVHLGSRCSCCEGASETVGHLFVSGPVAESVWGHLFQQGRSIPGRRRRPRLVVWAKPPSQCLKLNTDASVTAVGAFGGGVVRSSAGKVIFAFYKEFGEVHSVVHAEALALLTGLLHCQERRLAGVKA
ncbi:unnamed protein product [Coffea canephora]|uniref:DH200=94 genomic scaffold, scaffold_322 n=1 Tax=Coffea canephora TaxID=49390 RepID=A0A068VH03_COFCA|nr:unnamed protein product [Coffea canephora]